MSRENQAEGARAADPTDRPLTRRERYRQDTLAEAKRLAFAQLAERGVGGLSLNAIAKDMGMTGPALYRYVGSRDDLLTELVVDSYDALGAALRAAGERAAGRPPVARLRAVGLAYRDWAIANPQPYLLIFGTPVPGYDAPGDRTTPAAQAAFGPLLDALVELPADPLPAGPGRLDRESERWAGRIGAPPLPGRLLRYTVTTWTRLHGVVSLEIAGHFDPALPDGKLFFQAELDDILRPWDL
jgi:AcrR family transcriptional regulator